MFVKNGTECYELQPSAFGMSSAACNQIALPYHGELWGDLLLEVEREICERARDYLPQALSVDQSATDLDVSVVFNVQQRRIGIMARVGVKSPAVGDFTEHFSLRASAVEIATILDQFFDSGAKGLSDEHRTYYKNVYGLWRKAH